MVFWFLHQKTGIQKTVRRRTPHGNNNVNMKLRSIIEKRDVVKMRLELEIYDCPSIKPIMSIIFAFV